MIISASRRTDIPSYYSQWFYNRIKAGYIYVKNPMNPKNISRINLSTEVVDCIVFWSKNPQPMLKRLDEIKNYNYYFQFTLNSYGQDIEKNIPAKYSKVIETFKSLSDKIGSERIIWRYDPILLNSKYTIDYHIKYFEAIAKFLEGYTEKCTISFIDLYKKIKSNTNDLGIKELTYEEKNKIAKKLSQIASSYGLKMDTCAEDIDLSKYDITHAKCIDNILIEKIIGMPIITGKDKNQRPLCGCVDSIDIGAYNTCLNGCKYCYANFSTKSIIKNVSNHDDKSPLLIGYPDKNHPVNERKMESLIDRQLKTR